MEGRKKMFNKEKFKENINRNLKVHFGKTFKNALDYEIYHSLAKEVMEEITDNWNRSSENYSRDKQAYYLSAEFLMGRTLGNNLINLGIHDEIREAFEEIDIQFNKIEEAEEDAGLGNGGLGRLAACFLDSSATMNVPLHGYGIRYKYGIFRQKIKDGFQIEEADTWLKFGDPWSIRRYEDAVIISFSGGDVKAVPYDTPIIGFNTNNINTLRLWQAEPIKEFDFDLFNSQEYDKSVKEKNRAEDISRVLYPNDSKREGKILRLKQQYFFVSASIQDLIKKFKKQHGKDFSIFPKYNAVQLNDTHPVIAIPEFMRILVDNEKIDWETAWEITVKTFSYTNHTIMAEALEKWDIEIFKKLLPRIYEITKKIDTKFVTKLKKLRYRSNEINNIRIISNGLINMAWLAVHGCHTTNGVAQLHTDILKEKELNDWYTLYPKRFQNKTNGVTPRRWLLLSNKELSKLITELLKTDKWTTNLELLKQLEVYKDDKEILSRFLHIKHSKKEELVNYIRDNERIEISSNSIFDIQIKRLHEYKRQLLNAFHILDLYYRLKEDPSMDMVPRTFIFGAKAAPGYFRAKGIIKYINEITNLVNNDQQINNKIKVVFAENYRVTYAEKLFPAADISEQISTAGKEASGTGNMKFMINGTPTLGTYDGANVEIVEEAGIENNFIFGARVDEINEIYDSYDPKQFYASVPGLKRIVDTLIDGTFNDGGTGMFKDLYDSILEGTSWHRPDNYFILRDFDEYRKAHLEIDKSYRNRLEWARKCWINMCNSGKFSSDRTILEYAKDIWGTNQRRL